MRIEQLTFTRFIAAMAIVFFHFGKPLNIFSQPQLHTLLAHANYGVSYFFILSGFVMMIAYGRKSKVHWFSYLKNRFARIYPVYLLAIILSLIFKIKFMNETPEFSDVLLNIFAIQSWIPAKAMTVNFPGWSLSVEFLFYAIFPLAFNLFYRKFTPKQLCIPIGIIWLISQAFFLWALNSNWHFGTEKETENFLYYFPLLHLNQFLAGNLIGFFYITYLHRFARNFDIWIIVLGVLLASALLFQPDFLDYHNGLLVVLFAPMILLIAMNTGWISKISNHPFLVYLGEISYGIYILQVPVYWFTAYFLAELGVEGSLKIFLIYVFLLLAFSALSYQWIETPLRERIKKTIIKF